MHMELENYWFNYTSGTVSVTNLRWGFMNLLQA